MAGAYEDIIASVGNTPLVRINKLIPGGAVWAKLESRNPLSSVKDRIGVAMIDAASRVERPWVRRAWWRPDPRAKAG